MGIDDVDETTKSFWVRFLFWPGSTEESCAMIEGESKDEVVLNFEKLVRPFKLISVTERTMQK